MAYSLKTDLYRQALQAYIEMQKRQAESFMESLKEASKEEDYDDFAKANRIYRDLVATTDKIRQLEEELKNVSD